MWRCFDLDSDLWPSEFEYIYIYIYKYVVVDERNHICLVSGHNSFIQTEFLLERRTLVKNVSLFVLTVNLPIGLLTAGTGGVRKRKCVKKKGSPFLKAF